MAQRLRSLHDNADNLVLLLINPSPTRELNAFIDMIVKNDEKGLPTFIVCPAVCRYKDQPQLKAVEALVECFNHVHVMQLETGRTLPAELAFLD